jgi:hypothetical protein
VPSPAQPSNARQSCLDSSNWTVFLRQPRRRLARNGFNRTQRRGQLIDRDQPACQNLGCYHSGIWPLKPEGQRLLTAKNAKDAKKIEDYLLLTLRRRQRKLHSLMVTLTEGDGLRFGGNRRRLWRSRRQLGGDPIFARRQGVESEVAILVCACARRARSVVKRFRLGLCPNLRASYWLVVFGYTSFQLRAGRTEHDFQRPSGKALFQPEAFLQNVFCAKAGGFYVPTDPGDLERVVAVGNTCDLERAVLLDLGNEVSLSLAGSSRIWK